MRKTTTLFSVKSTLLFFATVVFFSCNNPETFIGENSEKEKDKYDGAAMRQQLEFERTKDPALGFVPKERLIAAYRATENSKQIAMRSRITSGTWIERGPYADEAGMNNGNIRGSWASITSGRMKAMWVDLADATGNTVWVGGIGGGLWKTTNFKDYPATWTPINDFFTNMSVGSICQDPTNPDIMYFGTGERSFNIDAIRGGGVWKSTDHGLNWTLLSATSSYFNVSKLLCDAAGNLYVGTIVSNTGGGSSGLFRSTNGGTSFTNISPNSINTRIADFVISSTGRFHVATGYFDSSNPGYRYTDNPSTVTSNSWTESNNPASNHLPETNATNQNCILACSGNTLYAAVSNSSGIVSNIYKSTNGGATWSATTPPSNSGNTALSNGQGWYCLGIDINPTNANNVIVGSLNCYSTTDGGTTWTRISDWSSNYAGATTGQYVHADIQAVKWFANDQVLVATDGGIFYSPDAGVNFEDRNSGLNIKQFYSCAFHPTLTNYFLAGSQDNGCHQFTTPGLNFTTEITGGDGSFVHIDQDQGSYQYASYVYNRHRRSVNNGDNWSAINFYKGTSTSPVDFGTFINPADYDNTANILYSGADAGEFFRWTTAQTTLAGSYYNTTGFPAGANIISISNLTGTVSALAVSPYTANRLYLGTGSSKIVRIDNAHTITSGSGGTDISGSGFPAGSTISSIAVGTDDNNLMVVFSNYGVSNIWVTTNGGTSWTAIDGNLPDMPVRWAVFDPTSSNTKAWIATETGVWSTTAINGSATVWTASPGFPTVRTDMIKYKTSDQNLVAATHGRGLWTQSLASTLPINTFVLRGKWNSNGTVALSWDYSNSASASGFDVESSTNGTYFTKAGSAQLNTNYSHQPVASDIYYRVKGKNIFGNVSYSNVIYLKKGEEIRDIAGLRLFPNPVKNYMKISFSASGKGIVTYQVTGINGQVSWKKDEELTATGEYIREWNMQHLKPGTYLLTVIYNNKKITQKFSKL